MSYQVTPHQKSLVLSVLVEGGWSPTERHASIATKEFQTAVGPKLAAVHLLDGDEYNFLLQADYWSEGRNVLEACGACVPKDATDETMRRLITAFADGIEQRVEQSYAARLFRPREGA